MRGLIVSASFLLAMTPAALCAQDDGVEPASGGAPVAVSEELPVAEGPAPDQDESLSELAKTLADPGEQQKMAAMIGAVGEVLMQLPVGPLAEAMTQAVPEEMAPDMPEIAHDATLRDLAGPSSARRMQAEIADKVPVMMGMLAGLAKGAETMRPALNDLGRQLQLQLSALKSQ